MYIRKHIARDERGLWFRHGDLVGVLGPGVHWNAGWLWYGGADSVDTFDVTSGRLQHKRLETLVREPTLREHLFVTDLADGERALVWKDNRLFDVLGPGVAAYWKDAGEWRVERFAIDTARFEHSALNKLVREPKLRSELLVVETGDAKRSLVWKDGRLHDVLGPGHAAYWKDAGKWFVEQFVLSDGKLEHRQVATLLKDERLIAELSVVELKDGQRALVWLDGRLADVAAPGTNAYWTAAGNWRVETFDVDEVRFAHPKVQAILSHPKAGLHLTGVLVGQEEAALLYRDGRFVEVLSPGLHVFWKASGKITWTSVELREQTLDVGGQEIMTADKVSIRLNLLVTLAVIDPVRAINASDDWKQAIYREAQLALRVAIGSRELDALLTEKDAVSDEVRDSVAAKADGLGVRVSGVGLRDVILPGDMRELFNGVIAAQKQAEANLIQRREETAAARSQANTARLLADNPALQRLRELEAVKEILAGTQLTFVLGDNGQGRSLIEQVKSLVEAPQPK